MAKKHLCEAILFSCIDWRLHPGLEGYFVKKHGYYDLVCSAGSIKGFCHKNSQAHFFKQIAISQRLHHSKTIILTMHRDCGAWEGLANFRTAELRHHRRILKKVEKIILQRFPKAKILKYFIEMKEKSGKWICSPKKI